MYDAQSVFELSTSLLRASEYVQTNLSLLHATLNHARGDLEITTGCLAKKSICHRACDQNMILYKEILNTTLNHARGDLELIYVSVAGPGTDDCLQTRLFLPAGRAQVFTVQVKIFKGQMRDM
jgi:hypothetical protein